ncbi:MAG: hypothetical protein QNJ20_18530 [Paracoccaceae bacterium]|nr:hypothetical protein [Paracoccaceae bacterium]
MSACGGSGAGGGGGLGGPISGPSIPTTGCTDASCTYGTTSSQLAGTGVLEQYDTSLNVTSRTVSRARANLNVPGNSVNYVDSAVNFTGSVVAGDITNSDAGIIAQRSSGSPTGLVSVSDASGYEFVKTVVGNTQIGITPYILDGYVGFVTDASVIPASGSASYSGNARGGIDTGSPPDNPILGIVNLTANFGSGNVDMVVDFANNSDGVGLVEVTGMTINGNTFSGGDLQIFTYDAIPAALNKTPSNVLGSGAAHQAAGVFFGVDAALALDGGGTTIGPDEVAGSVVAAGSDAQVYFSYAAD